MGSYNDCSDYRDPVVDDRDHSTTMSALSRVDVAGIVHMGQHCHCMDPDLASQHRIVVDLVPPAGVPVAKVKILLGLQVMVSSSSAVGPTSLLSQGQGSASHQFGLTASVIEIYPLAAACRST